jgi:HEAT repeat protein
MSTRAPGTAEIEEKVERLRNLHDGQAAIADVVSLGDAAIPALEALLRGPSQSLHHTRCWAADALAAIGTAPAAQALVRALRDCASRVPAVMSREAEDVVVSTVADHLGALSDPDALDALLDALDRRPYPGCARALARLGNFRAIPVLVRSLSEDTTRPAAMDALRQLGPAAIPRLAAAVADVHLVNGAEPPSYIDGRVAATALLGTLLPQSSGVIPDAQRTSARRTLSGALRDSERAVRLAAALSLSRCSQGRALAAVRMLVGALGDPDWRDAMTIMQLLTRLGPRIEGVVLAAITAKGHSQTASRRRRRAIWIAGQLGTPSAIATLASLSETNDVQARIAAVRALDRLYRGDHAPLYRYLDDPVPAVRRLSLETLYRHHALSIAHAARLLGDPDEGVRRLAAASLSEHHEAVRSVLGRTVLTIGMPLHGWRARIRLSWNALRWIVASRRAPGSTPP